MHKSLDMITLNKPAITLSVTLLILVATPLVSLAQDVNGMKLAETYNYSYVTNKFGAPDRYWSRESEFGLDEKYYYGQNFFRFSNNGFFSTFTLIDNRFAVFTLDLQGGIKVGEPVAKFNQLGFGQLEVKPDGSYYFRGIGDAVFEIFHNDGIITRMVCRFPS